MSGRRSSSSSSSESPTKKSRVERAEKEKEKEKEKARSAPQQGRGRGEAAGIVAMTNIVERQPGERSSSSDSSTTGIPGGQLKVSSSSGSGSSSSSPSSGDKTIRGRGGFKATELHTIPPTIADTSAKNAPGQKIMVAANFVQIKPLKDRQIFQYRFDFKPNVESVSQRYRLFGKINEDYFEKKCIFDGLSDGRSSFKLPVNPLQVELESLTERGQKIMVIVKNVGTVVTSFEMVRVYNMHMKQFLRALGFFQVSLTGAYVHPEFTTPIGRDTGIIAMRGYKTSANIHEQGIIMMNFESVQKLSQLNNVLQNMVQFKNQSNFRDAIKTTLTGKLVVTNYNKIIYRIEDVNFDLSPKSEFDDKRGGKITYERYYRERYNVALRDLNQPLILAVQNNKRRRDEETSGDRPDCYLIPELCNIAGLTDQQRNDTRLKMDLIRSSQIDPQERVAHLREFLKRLHGSNDVRRVLDTWAYEYGDDLIEIPCRILATEQVGFGRNMGPNVNKASWPQVDSKTASFDHLVTKERLAITPELKKLKIIIGRGEIPRSEMVMQGIRTGFQKIGLNPVNVEVMKLDGDNAHTYVHQLKQLPTDTSAAIVIIASQNKEKYDAIKKMAAVERGIITQVVTSRLMTDERKRGGAGVKIGIQMAAKLGGEPWHISMPMTNAMVCGYDTYHDTAKRGRSYGAFVASMNGTYSKWWSKADCHDHLDELSAHMSENLRSALLKYQEINKGAYPDRLIIYRDGVSDGQLEHVINVELKGIRKIVKEHESRIRLAFIVVNKKVGARFYWRNGNNYLNCAPGTVIDTVVTRKERYDFYLISQSTRNGTVAPTYFNIIHDETALDAAKHQIMAYKMCFAYYNWSGTVKVPAPCQYAHKLALLCGEHLHSVPNAQLNDRLHFL